MKITGKQTKTDMIDVIIDPADVILELKQRSVPSGLEYLKDGYWYSHDYFDYHKREDHYKKDRKATDEETELHKAFDLVLNFIENTYR